MACILDGTYTFVDGKYRDSSVPNLDYSDYDVTFNGEQLNFIGTIRADNTTQYLFAKGGTIESPIFPGMAIVAGLGISAFISEGNYEGDATVSICEKENDSDACPDVPFSESAPEKYADYFNEDGVFVPKASNP